MCWCSPADGIEEARDAEGEFYGAERLVQVIQGAAADGSADAVRMRSSRMSRRSSARQRRGMT